MRIAGLLVLVSLGGACSDDTSEEIIPVCDVAATSSSSRVAVVRQGGGPQLPGQAFLYANGEYLFVDESCHYWVNAPAHPWEPRTGTLDVTTATRIGASLHIASWSEVAGTWYGSGVADAPGILFDDGTSAVLCVALCQDDDIPARVQAMRDAFSPVAQDLWERGAPSDGPVRAVAVETTLTPGTPFQDWPLTRPLTDFVKSNPAVDLAGTLESDPTASAALRELRASFVRGDHGPFSGAMLPVTSGGSYYELYVRDALPLEDETGLVPLTPPSP